MTIEPLLEVYATLLPNAACSLLIQKEDCRYFLAVPYDCIVYELLACSRGLRAVFNLELALGEMEL